MSPALEILARMISGQSPLWLVQENTAIDFFFLKKRGGWPKLAFIRGLAVFSMLSDILPPPNSTFIILFLLITVE